MATLEIVKEFPAMKPQIVFPYNSYGDLERNWAEPIEVIHHAAIALTEDVAMFRAMGYHKTHTAAGEEFLRSLFYYAKVLVWDSFLTLEPELQAYTCTPALTIKKSLGSKLENARTSLEHLSSAILDLLGGVGWEFDRKTLSTSDMVPTASPYQLLYQMIGIKKLSSAPAGDQITRTFCKFHPLLLSVSLQKQACLALPELPPGIVRVTSDALCGRPTMIFVAGSPDLSHIVFGANEAAWGEFTAISSITRMARDTRLQHYIPPAMAAFQALRQKEVEALAGLQNDSSGTSNREDLLWSARSRAIEQMRSDDTFLGGENEMGIALRPPKWSINQGCYLCQGMMGYQSPKSWNENQRRKYILKFD